MDAWMLAPPRDHLCRDLWAWVGGLPTLSALLWASLTGSACPPACLPLQRPAGGVRLRWGLGWVRASAHEMGRALRAAAAAAPRALHTPPFAAGRRWLLQGRATARCRPAGRRASPRCLPWSCAAPGSMVRPAGGSLAAQVGSFCCPASDARNGAGASLPQPGSRPPTLNQAGRIDGV